MRTRVSLLLFAGGLVLPYIVAQFQPYPGYLDADYYFVGGARLASGYGFSEPFIWNYLENPSSVIHPSHGYWMPLASIVAAGSMLVTGEATYGGARLVFLLIAAFVPVLTAHLSYALSRQEGLAALSGLLAIFSVYHAPFVGVTDNFGIYMLLGGASLLLALRSGLGFWLGVLAGLMTLARADGILWLALGLGHVVLRERRPGAVGSVVRPGLVVVAGFSLVMLPWFLRNVAAFGSPLAPGGSRVLWLGSYDEIFSYPASALSFGKWIASGPGEILRDRLWAAGQNLQNAIAAHGSILLFPFIVAGIWLRRDKAAVRIAAAGWLALFLGMTVLLPFAGARGGFFHAGAAFQPMWWALAPVGLSAAVESARRRGLFTVGAQGVFRAALVLAVVILTAYVLWLRIGKLGWGEGEALYPRIDAQLQEHGAGGGDIVVVRNPAGYYLSTGRSAIVIPFDGPETIQAAAARYGARFLVLEPRGTLPRTRALYEHPENVAGFLYLGDVDDTRLFEIVSR